MPFDDNELRLRYNHNIPLSADEKNYATWARELKAEINSGDIYMSDYGRTPNSILTIVGHNIVGHVIDNAIRRGTNTIDLDFWSTRYDAILSLNITTGQTSWIGDTLNHGEDQDYYAKQAAAIDEHMKALLKYKPFIKEVAQCSSFAEFESTLYDFAPLQEVQSWRQVAINYGALNEEIIRNECENGHLGKLLGYGLDANYLFSDGTSLLFDAIMRNDIAAVNLLTEYQVDMSLLCDREYKTEPLLAAKNSMDKDLFLAVAQAQLYHSIRCNDEDGIKHALQMGANIFHNRKTGRRHLVKQSAVEVTPRYFDYHLPLQKRRLCQILLIARLSMIGVCCI